MVEKRRGNGEREDVLGPFLCVSGVRDLNYETQLSVPGRSPCPWHQATDCLNQGTPSTLPSIVSSSSAHSGAHPVLAPLRIVLLLPQGQVVVRHNWDRGTPFLYKGLSDPHETHHVSSIVLESSADNPWLIRRVG